MSAAEGQRPRNYLSCCSCFCLICALSTPTTMLPLIFFPSFSFLHFLSLHFLSLILSLSLTPPSLLLLHLSPSVAQASLMHYQLPPPSYPPNCLFSPFYIFNFIISLFLFYLYFYYTYLPVVKKSIHICAYLTLFFVHLKLLQTQEPVSVLF